MCDREGNEIEDKNLLESIADLENSESETYWESWDHVLRDVCVFMKKHTTAWIVMFIFFSRVVICGR